MNKKPGHTMKKKTSFIRKFIESDSGEMFFDFCIVIILLGTTAIVVIKLIQIINNL